MEINLNAIGFRNGVPYNTTLNLVKRADGSWHAKNFDDILNINMMPAKALHRSHRIATHMKQMHLPKQSFPIRRLLNLPGSTICVI